MVHADVFGSALSVVGTSVALCQQSRATRQRAEEIRSSFAGRPRLSTPLLLRLGHSEEGGTTAGLAQVDGADEGGGVVRRHFGAGLGYAYTVDGLLDGVPVSPSLDKGGTLTCDPLLWAYAEVLVALGETLAFGDEGKTTPAGLDSAVQALTTLTHCVHVTDFTVSVQAARSPIVPNDNGAAAGGPAVRRFKGARGAGGDGPAGAGRRHDV
jgi:hypothetical protein